MVQLKTLVAVGAIGGGLSWIAEYVLERAGASDGLASLLFWVGLVLMTIAFLGAGINLVRTGNHWLELVVGVATPALVWSVVWAFRGGNADAHVVDGVVGVLAIAFGIAVFLRQQHQVDHEEHLRPGRRRAV